MLTAVPGFVNEDLARLGFEIEPDALARLAAYLDLLLETNKKFNLTSIRDSDDAWRRHVIDSLTLLPWLDELGAGSTLIDVGSGGGLPGVPLAVVRPDLHITLLDATAKKARFLEQCLHDLPLAGVSVVTGRAESVGRDPAHRERYDVAVCRAIGPMRELLEYTLPLVRVGGRLLAMKGPRAEQELEVSADALATLGAGDLHVFDAYPPEFDFNTVVVRVAKDRPTPKTYPRSPGTPRQQPL